MFYLTIHCLQQHLFNSLKERRKEGNVLFNDKHSTHFIYGYMVSDISEKEREIFYLTMHSTHFYLRLYGVKSYFKQTVYNSIYSIPLKKEGRKCFM